MLQIAETSWSRSFLGSLSERPSVAREDAILEAVREGWTAPITWIEIASEHGDHKATLYVSADALRVGNEQDSVRVNVSARTMQRIADLLGCVLPTTRICDLIWEQATVRLPPCIQRCDGEMSNTSRMIQHHERVEATRAGRTGLIENVGKHWVLTNRLQGTRKAANYGWYDPRAPHVMGAYHMWQPLGLAHDVHHVDYSQVVRLVQQRCTVDGASRDITEVMKDPELAPLVSSEGPLRFVRLPGVPVEN